MLPPPQDMRTVEQLPAELELGTEFVFHSIFACPVSRWVGRKGKDER